MQNIEWIFSGIGVFVLGIVGKFGWQKFFSKNDYITEKLITKMTNQEKIDYAKKIINILFIDDDTKFKVVKILKKTGWERTKSVTDIDDLDSIDVRDTNIFFVDIQGVGKILDFKDEGLGLALALKKKYPNKKVIIYSAEPQGERFHAALRKADTCLPKNAEPYEFQQVVEEFSIEIIEGNFK